VPYYYFARLDDLDNYHFILEIYPQVNLLVSFFKFFNPTGKMKLSDERIRKFAMAKRLLVDSGVYTFRTKPELIEKVSIEGYVQQYISFVSIMKELPNFVGYFEVDLYKALGVDRVFAFRDMIEEKVGLKSIPVWQPDVIRDNEFAYRLVEELGYDYIAIALSKINGVRKKRLRTYYQSLIAHTTRDIVEGSKKKIHLLGLTFTDKFFNVYKFYSFDNTNYVNYARDSRILYFFDGEGLRHFRFMSKDEKKWRYKSRIGVLESIIYNILEFAKKLEEQEDESFYRQDNDI
jgi:hypothetical protein